MMTDGDSKIMFSLFSSQDCHKQNYEFFRVYRTDDSAGELEGSNCHDINFCPFLYPYYRIHFIALFALLNISKTSKKKKKRICKNNF